MTDIIKYVKTIEKFQDDMRGVFTLSDLRGILPCEYINTFYRIIARLEKAQIIKRFKKGVYVTEKFDLYAVSQKICPNSYISFESVLVKNLALGTVPKYEIRAIKIGKRREYNSSLGNVLHLGVAKHLYFGFETVSGINFADNEKALLDTLYYYNKGMKFYFDIYSDVNLSVFSHEKINDYLKKYRNPKFINFVKSFLQRGNI